MTPDRWPVHPKPVTGESLASWLERIAAIYGLSMKQLLEYDLGVPQATDAILQSPDKQLVDRVAVRTGTAVDTVWSMADRWNKIERVIDTAKTDLGEERQTIASEPEVRVAAIVENAAIYCRVSADDQFCEQQERELTAYANEVGWQIVGVWKETENRRRENRKVRQGILSLAQAGDVQVVLVKDLKSWSFSALDLIGTVQVLHDNNVCLIARSGPQFDLQTPQGRLIASVISFLTEFERDIDRERVKFGIAAAKARGVRIGRQLGQRPKSDLLAQQVVALVNGGASYRQIAMKLKISKTTVTEIMKRHRQEPHQH